jgi:hypothetical protein
MLKKQLFIIALGFMFATASFAQTAKVQVIHNCADTLAAQVDIYINGILQLDNLGFRKATPFIDLAAGVNISIGVALSNSATVNDTLVSFDFNLVDGEKYIIVASGLIDTAGYSTLQPFSLEVFNPAQINAANSANTDVLVYHGSTDAPMVDVVENGTSVVNNISYGEFSANYLQLPTANYILSVTDTSGVNTVASFTAPLATLNLQDTGLVVLASGFLDPSNNNNGAAFGLWAALPVGGDLIELPLYIIPTAQVQVIHNCADTTAAMVDVYINGNLEIDNFEFRKATPFINLPAGVNISVGVALSNSTSINDTLVSFDFNLVDGQKYIMVASGLVDTAGYSTSQPFSLEVFNPAQINAVNSANTDVLVYHGSTDAPMVDVVENGTSVVNNISYGEFSNNYLQLPTANYILSVSDTSGANTVASYTAPLAALNLQDTGLVVLASGFLNPSNNNNGAAFGLWAALPVGGDLIELPLYIIPTAQVQVIHNCADTAAALVDIYINGNLELDNFGFRKATPFINLPAGVNVSVGVALSNSSSINDTLVSFDFNLVDAEKYIMVASGLIDTAGYSTSQPFSLEVFNPAQLNAGNPANTNVLVYHGATDAPIVDIVESGSTLVNNIAYGQFSANYLQLPTNDYVISVKDSSGVDTIASYNAPLDALNLQDSALVILASGFLDPANNNNGPAFGLWAALPMGGDLFELSEVLNIPFAQVQIIHNSADKLARVVDVWVNNVLVLDSFVFRTCTPFIDLPADSALNIVIQRNDSTDISDALGQYTLTLMPNEKYIVVANGIASASGYTPAQAFNLDVFMGAEEASGNPANTNVLVYHGATDAPPVNVISGTTTLVDSIYYAQFNNAYLQLPTLDYTLALTDTLNDTIAKYSATLSTLNLQGQSLVVLASGFYNRAANRNGSIFGLYAALPSGGNLIPLPQITEDSARVQIIHNCADLNADIVDVWINDTLFLDNFTFRKSTPFITVPAGIEFDLTVTGENSTDTISDLKRFYYKLEDKTYIMVAQGIASTTGYDPIVPFDFDFFDNGQETAVSGSNTDVLVYHGGTDAPVIDVLSGNTPLIENLLYSSFDDNYLQLPTASYTLNLKEGFGSQVIASYAAPLTTLGLQGDAVVIVASGFINPNVNSNGPAFGLWVSLAGGGDLIPLTAVTSIENLASKSFSIYPNPASDRLMISSPASSSITVVNIYNQLGEIVLSEQIPANTSAVSSILIGNLANGLYTVELLNDQTRLSNKVSILK